MSTGLEMEVIEAKPGQWYYVLQNWDCPAQAWDWREYATAYGPFETDEKCLQHSRDNHANPGGYSVCENAIFEMSPVYEKLIAEAEKPEPQRGFGRWLP